MMQASIDVVAEARRVLSAPKTPHAQLGLRPGASFAEIKSRYRELCSLHPDKSKSELAAAAFAIISAAYTTLHSAHTQPEPLHSSQPEATQGSRWQAFTAQPTPQPAWQPQQQEQPFASGGAPSQENRFSPTPPAANSGGGSAWQASKWGQYGSSSVLRPQPKTAAPVQPAGSTHVRGDFQSSADRRHDMPQSGGCSGSSDDSWSDEGTDEGAPEGSCRWHGGATVLPAAFYGSTRNSPKAAQPAPASLYGMFVQRISSDLGSWQASTHHPEQPSHAAGVRSAVQQSLVAPLAVPQPAAAQGGSRWSAKSSQLAELLRKPLVGLPQTASTAVRASRPSWQEAEGDVPHSGSSSDDEEDKACISDYVPEPGRREDQASPQTAAREAARAVGNAIIQRGKGRALQRYCKKRQASSGKGSGKGAGKGSGKGSGKRQARLKLTSVTH